jgi:hypothetical protein
MPRKGEEYESGQIRIDVDEDSGRPFWRGAGADDKEETCLGYDQPIMLDPRHFPPGTRVVIVEPWDEEFYWKLFEERSRTLGLNWSKED